MVDLARHSGEGPVALREIAERQNLTLKYTESIMALLLRDKLVQSLRGKAGGYRLTREPEKYNLYEILTAAEGELAPVHCFSLSENECPISKVCVTKPMWEGLHKVVENYLTGISLKQLENQDGVCPQ